MRLNGSSGGPTIAKISFFLPWKRGAAATARATAPPVASSRWRAGAGQHPIFPCSDDDSARARQRELDKIDLHQALLCRK